jgi:hypothetical protein
MEWRLDSRSARTLGGLVFKFELQLSSRTRISRQNKTYRKPLIYAMELAEEMKREGLTQAGLARKHSISRARVNQWLALLGLPDREKRRLQAMGDNWECRMLTERALRDQLHR